ncbi:MAG: aminotransferase class III-fold pyridoxal phosphate-dependent enzyme [Bacteroidetes bacterium]|nr:aminotransferase class III-fold pyridoxal phosphate-dependent enzyme [Bacteroidota bacterium]
MSSSFSISEYHNVDEVYKQIANLMSQPPVNVPKTVLDNYLSKIEATCPKSKAMTSEAMKYIPGGVQHNLAFNYPFPIVFNKAEGAYLHDIDGNRYIDFIQAGGPTVLGSNPAVVREKCIELLNTCGPSTGLFHEYELKIAKMICDNMPSVDMFRMLNSGSEAVIAAVRTARIITGKTKIIKVGGAYHGWMDQMVYGIRIPGTGRFESHGIPRAYTSHTQEVYPNDLGQLERTLFLNKFRGGTAAVILEPLGPESGTYPMQKGYNKAVRELCDKYGSLMIFDEVVTAFRVGMSGAQGYFDVKPDLTVFGKVVAGGYPSAGGLGGKKEYMEYLSAGLGGAKKKQSKVGGTMAANPLSCVAGYYTLVEIQKQNACVKAGQAGDRLAKGLRGMMERYNLPFVSYNQGSICHLESAGTLFVKINYLKILKVLAEIKERKQMMEEMGAAYTAEGIITLAGSRMYTSMADTDEVIDDALDRFDRVFSKMKR